MKKFLSLAKFHSALRLEKLAVCSCNTLIDGAAWPHAKLRSFISSMALAVALLRSKLANTLLGCSSFAMFASRHLTIAPLYFSSRRASRSLFLFFTSSVKTPGVDSYSLRRTDSVFSRRFSDSRRLSDFLWQIGWPCFLDHSWTVSKSLQWQPLLTSAAAVPPFPYKIILHRSIPTHWASSN